jgi:regulator of sigma D
MRTETGCVSPWLQQRRDILIILNKLAGLLPYRLNNTPIYLTNFFQLLIDYTCAGHLQIFTLLVKQNNNHKACLAQRILHKINCTTNYIINFNYKFNKFKNISAHDIALLLEQFADRIELEDLLLAQFGTISKHLIN